jgi:hypothetical protein
MVDDPARPIDLSGFAPRTELQANNKLATWALVMALLSYVVCPVFLAIAALVVAHRAKGRTLGPGGDETQNGLILATRILAYVNIALVVAVWVALTVSRAT